MKNLFCRLILAVALGSLLISTQPLIAQGTAFTYQGQLQNNGSPASGTYNLAFSLFNTNVGGVAMAGPMITNGVGVSNGLFVVTIDFGEGVFTGASNWLEIGVETNGGGAFTTLAPRQQLTPTPYAITAANVNGLQIQPNAASGAPNVIAGSSVNYIAPGYFGSVIAGGGATNYSGMPSNSIAGNFDVIAGGQANVISSLFDNIAGGWNNLITADTSMIGGGQYNQVNAPKGVIGGGFGNGVNGTYGTVGGGQGNFTYGEGATIPGGQNNQAYGVNSFAAGFKAQALHDGAFVWSDNSTNTLFPSSGSNQFLIRATGGVGINTNNPNGSALNVNGTVTAGNFVGSGAGLTGVTTTLAAGTISPPEVLTGGNITAVPNTIYFATNTLESSGINLPASANVGDTVQINGTADWVVFYPPGQFDWTVQAGTLAMNWISVASAQSGARLVAVDGNQIYTSANYGVNWTVQPGAPSANWVSVASSAAGNRLVAVIYGGQIYTSANYGVTWTAQAGAPSANWFSVASSVDGTHLVAVINGGQIYTSANSGVNWTAQTNGLPASASWSSVASSLDGTHLVAAVYGSQIYTSANSGANWTAQTGGLPASAGWSSVASSSDGTDLVAAIYGGQIYTSANSGVTWTAQAGGLPGSTSWSSVASSQDGTHLVAAVNGGQLYVSINSGVSWTAQTGGLPDAVDWSSVASSSDGTHLVAIGDSQIYTGGSTVSGSPGSSEQFQYVGNGVWQPVANSSLAGDVTGTQGATVVSTVGGQTAANVASGASAANAATSTNTPSTIVMRDSTGSFVAQTITASNFVGTFAGNGGGLTNLTAVSSTTAATATTATTATNFSGSLAGNVTGTQGATVVFSVGGQTAASVASGAIAANAATSTNTPNTIVMRDGSGNFAAGTIIANTATLASNVGIGTTAPSEVLDVSGGIRATGATTATFGSGVEIDYNGNGDGDGRIFAYNRTASVYLNLGLGDYSHGHGMVIQSGGDVAIGTTNISHMFQVGAAYCDGGAWVSGSDRNSKAGFMPVNTDDILAKVAALPITRWHYPSSSGTPHLGPMAQDFYAAFGTGSDDRHIADVDEGGVALAAIQGLNKKEDEKDAEIKTLKQENHSLQQRLDALERVVQSLAEKKPEN
jgi:hypothetical protein